MLNPKLPLFVPGKFDENGKWTPSGRYFYRNGWNPTALMALFPAVILSAIISLVPDIEHILGPFNWFISAAVAAVLYRVFSKPV
mgnify:FL=1